MVNLESSGTALLVMDLQTDIVGRLGDKAVPILEAAKGVVDAARQAKVPIIYVVVGFRPGYPELNPRNASAAMIAKSGQLTTTTPGSDIVSAVKPADEDVIVWKHRVGAFSGTDMDLILRAKGIHTLVMFGLSTSGVVLSTVRHASDCDYQIVIVKDCCADGDDEVHRVLTEKIFPRQCTVTTASEVTAAFSKM